MPKLLKTDYQEPAVPAVVEAPGVVDVLKEITDAIKRLVALHSLTKAMLDRPVQPVNNDQILDRMAEIQFLTQQTMDNLREAVADSQKNIPTFRPPTTRDIELSVTERDAWGRISKLKAHLEDK